MKHGNNEIIKIKCVIDVELRKEINMTYTVQLDFFIDGDEILSDEEVSEELKEMLNDSCTGASNIRVLDVND